MNAFSRAFAQVIVSGRWTQLAVLSRCRVALPMRMNVRWLPDFVERLFLAFGDRTFAPPQETVRRFVDADEPLSRVLSRRKHPPHIDLTTLNEPHMMPALPQFVDWQLPELTTTSSLADWLEISPDTLEQLADTRGFETLRTIPAARHYRYRWIIKRGGRSRLFEMPKPRLKSVQRRILAGILDRIPPHSAAHAFRKGHSIKTCLTPHVGQRVVLHYDLRDFFPSIRASQVFGLFRMVGYPEPVARLLTGCCTNRTPRDVRQAARGSISTTDRAAVDVLYRSAHLPQGAPTSPAIANLLTYRLDCRLSGLAESMNAQYSRYADDLIFSGDGAFRRQLHRFGILALAIVIDEGFHIRRRKTRIMPVGRRQQVAGVVLNQRLNVPRRDYDALRATLFNCARRGPESQNKDHHADFRAHLLGRIGWVTMLNSARGQKLRRLFDQIAWGNEPDVNERSSSANGPSSL